MDLVREQIRARNISHFDLVKRVNAFCQQSQSRLSIYNRDPQQLIAACLMLKVFEDVQSSVLLLESGLYSQSRSLLRIATEALIILAKVANSTEFFKAYAFTGERERLKLLNAIKTNPLYASEEIQESITPELIEQVKKSVEGTENRILEQWARDVKLDVQYDVVYRLFSQEVHTHPRMIEKYLVFREDGEVGQIGWGPWTERDIRPELFEAAKILLLAIDVIGNLFELNIQSEIKEFWKEIKDDL